MACCKTPALALASSCFFFAICNLDKENDSCFDETVIFLRCGRYRYPWQILGGILGSSRKENGLICGPFDAFR